MKIQKYISIFLLCLITIAVTACTRKNEVNVNQPVNNANAEPIELVFYNLFDENDAFAGQIQAFESLYPNVKVQYEKFTNPQEYEEFIINELAEGKGPDIFAIHNTWMNKHRGKLAPMPVDLPIPMNAAKFEQTFFDVAVKDLIFDGNIYGIPLSIDTLALYYNSQYLISGVTGTNTPATTWEGIKKQVIALTKQDKSKERFAVTGIALGRSDNIERATDILLLMMLQFGTQFLGDDGKAAFALQQGTIEGTGKPYFPGRLALELYTSFGLPSYNHYSWNEFITGADPELKEIGAFVRGKTAMILGYSYMYEDMKKYISSYQKVGRNHIELSDIRTIEAPQVIDPALNNTRIAYASYFPLVVSKNSQHQRAAWQFIQFISSKESLQTYFEKTNKTTSRLDMQEEQSLDPIYGVFARQAKYAKSYPIVDDSFYDKTFSQAITNVIATISVQLALQEAQQRINCAIEKNSGNAQFRGVDCFQ